MNTSCESCKEHVPDGVRDLHWTEGPKKDGYGHVGLCCDCFDLKLGMPFESVNRHRVSQGKEPLPASLERKT